MNIERHPRNAEVWTTEWRIACAGGKLAELPCGPATYDCRWYDRAGSHLIWLREPRVHDPTILLPCAHSYQRVVIEDPGKKLPLEYPSPPDVRREIAMWSSLNGWLPGPSQLRLRRVEGEAGWEAMRKVRVEIERPFGAGPAAAARMVDHIQRRRQFLAGDWYVAEVVGEIGLVVFDLPSVRLGRLQDVDILPRFQGRGFGRELLDAIREKPCEEAAPRFAYARTPEIGRRTGTGGKVSRPWADGRGSRSDGSRAALRQRADLPDRLAVQVS